MYLLILDAALLLLCHQEFIREWGISAAMQVATKKEIYLHWNVEFDEKGKQVNILSILCFRFRNYNRNRQKNVTRLSLLFFARFDEVLIGTHQRELCWNLLLCVVIVFFWLDAAAVSAYYNTACGVDCALSEKKNWADTRPLILRENEMSGGELPFVI